MRKRRAVSVTALVAIAVAGCGTSDDLAASREPVSSSSSVQAGCTTSTVAPNGEPWRGTAPANIPRGQGNQPMEPPPTLAADQANSAAEAAARDPLVGPLLEKAVLVKALPWDVYTKSSALGTKAVGSLLYYRLDPPADVSMALGTPVLSPGESGWVYGEDGLPVLEPSKEPLFRGAVVIGIYVLESSSDVYMVQPYDYMPRSAC